MEKDIIDCIETLRKAINNPKNGLPEDIFLFATEITPMVNVDLLVRGSDDRILLAWRNDQWWGQGWHVPGGILRLKETFEERIRLTAIKEFGTEVLWRADPIEIKPIIVDRFKQRGHFITFVYECQIPSNYDISIFNSSLRINDTGFLKWHSSYPEDMLRCHDFYRKYFINSG